jgi:hypothetical protein
MKEEDAGASDGCTTSTVSTTKTPETTTDGAKKEKASIFC